MPRFWCVSRSLLPAAILLAVVLVGAAFARAHEPGPDGHHHPHGHDHGHPTASTDPAARWWKGNLHTHTLWSDGDEFPEMVADWYREQGYHFLGLSDHNVLAVGQRWMKIADVEKRGGSDLIDKYRHRFGESWVETRGSGETAEVRLKPLDEFRTLVEERQKFLMIPAEEISNSISAGNIHIGAINIHEAMPPLPGATVVETINNSFRDLYDRAERSGREMLAHLNHPNFRWAVTAEDLAQIALERHFEVYNGHPSVHHEGDEIHPSVERMWDIANTIRLVDLNFPPLMGVGNDDSHHYHGKPDGSTPGRGWIMVRATHLTPEYILRAMKAGDYYATSGVTLDDVRYDADQRTLKIDVHPQGDEKYTTTFIGTRRGTSTAGEEVTDTTNDPPTRVSRKYSDKIGEVFATVEGLHPSYTLKGDELYVRAVVTSTLAPVVPSFENQKQQAWTQPVGWKLRENGQQAE